MWYNPLWPKGDVTYPISDFIYLAYIPYSAFDLVILPTHIGGSFVWIGGTTFLVWIGDIVFSTKYVILY